MASSSSSPPLANVLSKSKSPYLLQHKDNPVAWQEFTPETIALARELDKPIFLSSGYSACHWCHVLAHESFEDEETANMMNEHFINIKVDREERPDVDRVYMTYLQATQGGGGWPLSVFMTPNLEPFFAGTYFPNARFKNLLGRIEDLWEEDRASCEKMGKEVVSMLHEMGAGASSRVPGTLDQILSTSPAQKIYSHLAKTHDPRYGGFASGGRHSRGPKFPSVSLTLEPLARLSAYPGPADSPDIREEARAMGMKMIRGIWEGGIRDQVGNGVARYSVDEKWIVPHFEKMLYDQAQLVTSAIDFALLSDPSHANGADKAKLEEDRKICFNLAADILEYTLRDLYSPEGGFYSAEDADSAPALGAKKAEGAFYIWSKTEMDEVLGEHAKIVEFFYGVKLDGNVDPVHDAHGEMTGMNILYQARSYAATAAKFSLSEDEIRKIVKDGSDLLKKRRDETRERPGLDDKILTAWNGLTISALARAASFLPEDYPVKGRCLSAADKAVQFIRERMWDPANEMLYRSWREGRGPQAQTDDYAFLIRGLLDLYDAAGQESHLLFAVELQKRQDELFWDEAAGGYFASAPDEHVLVRMKDSQDGAEPSATSVSVHNLSRLSLLVSNEYEKYEKRAEETYLSIGAELKQVPRAFAYCVAGLMDLEKGYRELVVTGTADDEFTRKLLQMINGTYLPNKVLIRIDPAHPPKALAELNETVKSLLGETKPSLRICEGGTCGMPITDLAAAERAISGEA